MLRPRAVSFRDTPARWLIVADAAGVADTLAAALRAAGDDPHVLQAGTGALGRAIDEATRRGTPIAGVVHLPALDIAIDDATAASTLWADQERLVREALDTVQTLAAAQWSEQPPTLWFITRGAQSTRLQEGSNPAQATVWGLSHVVAMEHPELRCRRVDLDTARAWMIRCRVSSPSSTRRLVRIKSRCVASGRLLRRLVRRDAATLPTTPGRLSAEHTYLVTGGLRGLGLRVAEWLVEQGARSLVLMGRRAPDPTAEAVIRRLEAHGARVMALTGDVAREADVRRVLDEIAKSMPALRGIVHAAGVLDDGVVAAQSWARFATVMAPKVLGHMASSSADRTARLFRAVFVRRRDSRLSRPGESCRGERVRGCVRVVSPGTWTGDGQYQLGAVGGGRGGGRSQRERAELPAPDCPSRRSERARRRAAVGRRWQRTLATAGRGACVRLVEGRWIRRPADVAALPRSRSRDAHRCAIERIADCANRGNVA